MPVKTEPKTKYDGFLGRTATVEPTVVEETSASEPDTSVSAPIATVPARKAPAKAMLAKSKDPSIRQYSILLKIDTHTEATFFLSKQRTRKNMSDLVQDLLAEWVSKNRAKA